MKQLKILIGISNSGKSSYAAKLVQENPQKYVRINRDDIRSLVYGYNDETIVDYYGRKDIHKLEKQVTKYEDTLIHEGLSEGKTVIIDSTNLKKSYTDRYKYWNVPIELCLFPILLKDALIRNESRRRKVNEEIITKQYNRYVTLSEQLEGTNTENYFTPVVLDNSKDKPNAYVFDIDGCLAEKGNRRSPFDWNKVGLDTPIEPIVKLNQLVNSSKSKNEKIIIATGRDGVCIDETEKWLEKHQIEYDEIYIRPKGDYRPDWEIKKEMAQEIVKNNYISFWADDRIQVSRYLRSLGIKVLNVEYNNF